MNRLKKNQLGSWCSFCQPKTTKAVYVQRGWRSFACECHKEDLLKIEKAEERLTEADYQTWMKL